MRHHVLLPLLAALLAAASPALASMTYQSNHSQVVTSYMYYIGETTGFGGTSYYPAAGLGPMSVRGWRSYGSGLMYADATLTGAFAPDHAAANASLRALNNLANQSGPGSGYISVRTVWDFTFTLDQAHEFSLTGLVGPGLQDSCLALYGYDAAGDPYTVFNQDVSFAPSDTAINLAGALDPGRYRLYVNALLLNGVPHTDIVTSSSLDFAVAPVTIPAPASIALVLGGLAMLSRRRR